MWWVFMNKCLYVGVIIGDVLLWSAHVDHIIKKVNNALNSMKQICLFMFIDCFHLITQSKCLIQLQFDSFEVVCSNLSKGLVQSLQ